MSLSPADSDVEPAEPRGFRAASEQLSRMVEEGFSWSGNERNCAFLNVQGGRFADVSALTGFDFPDDGRSMAVVDWDHDGDLDIWLGNRTAPRIRFLRNESPAGHHFLALRLEGRTCNRDAIGARVEAVLSVEGRESTLIRTVRAGEGFLGQSSKWVHFGLGTSETVERLVVRWPGGGAEEFIGVAADRHYRVVEGQRRLEPWTPPTRALRIDDAPLQMPRPTEQARILFTSRVALPPLNYQPFEGTERPVANSGNGPLLLNLWATDCRACLVELDQFARHESQLRYSGLRVLALSVEATGETAASSSQDAREILARLNFPFDAGVLSPESAYKLQLVHDHLIRRRRPLPVPSSFLIDAEGRVAALYKGPVEVRQIVADARNLELDGPQLMQASLPFGGRWIASPGEVRLTPLVSSLARAGYSDEALVYATEHRQQLAGEAEFADTERFLAQSLLDRVHTHLQNGEYDLALKACLRAVELQPDSFEAYHELGTIHAQRGDFEQALKDYRRAIELRPESSQAFSNLGLTYHRLGRFEQALVAFGKAIESKPDDAEIHYNRGNTLWSLGRVDEAHASYSKAIELNVDYAHAYNNRGTLLAQQGKWQQAVDDYTRAIELNPQYASTYNNRGNAYKDWGRYDLALADYAKAIELNPSDVNAHTKLAWLLSTCADAKYRDGERAIGLAREACELSQWKSVGALSALAAASAEAGRFADAVNWQTRAMELAPDSATAQLSALRELYRAGKPHREPEHNSER